MNIELLQQVFEKQQQQDLVPSNDDIAQWAMKLICLLYPEQSKCSYASVNEMDEAYQQLEMELVSMFRSTKGCQQWNTEKVAKGFFEQIPELYRLLNTDVQSLLLGDPAAKNVFEIIRAYPGFFAMCFYRIAHNLYKLDVPYLPRILTEFAHSKTGIDIHPAAEIGEYFFIDHGTGIVIGETSQIGDHVKLYQGVTLGALSVEKEMANTKRHPTVEDHVVIYSGATILGGETIIGRNSIIGGNVWMTKSVSPGSVVYHQGEVRVVEAE